MFYWSCRTYSKRSRTDIVEGGLRDRGGLGGGGGGGGGGRGGAEASVGLCTKLVTGLIVAAEIALKKYRKMW